MFVGEYNDDGSEKTWENTAKKQIREVARECQFNQRPSEPTQDEPVPQCFFDGESIDPELTASGSSVIPMRFEEYGITSDMRKYEDKGRFNLESEKKCK